MSRRRTRRSTCAPSPSTASSRRRRRHRSPAALATGDLRHVFDLDTTTRGDGRRQRLPATSPTRALDRRQAWEATDVVPQAMAGRVVRLRHPDLHHGRGAGDGRRRFIAILDRYADRGPDRAKRPPADATVAIVATATCCPDAVRQLTDRSSRATVLRQAGRERFPGAVRRSPCRRPGPGPGRRPGAGQHRRFITDVAHLERRSTSTPTRSTSPARRWSSAPGHPAAPPPAPRHLAPARRPRRPWRDAVGGGLRETVEETGLAVARPAARRGLAHVDVHAGSAWPHPPRPALPRRRRRCRPGATARREPGRAWFSGTGARRRRPGHGRHPPGLPPPADRVRCLTRGGLPWT